MAGKLKGITIEIGGDTKPLINALKEPNKEISNLQSKLKQVNQMLKFDPSNTELLAKKQQLLGQQVNETKHKLQTLKQAQQEFIASGGDVTSKGYLDLQQEIQKTEASLKSLEKQQTNVSAELQSFGIKIGQTGEKLTSAGKAMMPVTAGIGAIGTASMVAWKEVDEAMDGIAKGTGATGEKLEAFQNIAKNVYKEMPVDIENVGVAVADLNTRMNLTGPQLEKTTKSFLKFSEINNTDVGPAIEGVAKAMADANIPFSQTDEVLDALTATSQSSGLATEKLTSLLSENGAVMRGLGFDTNQTIAMLATFEKNGVNTSNVLTGMKYAMKECGKAGKDGKEEMNAFFKGVQEGSVTSADAIELFGSRAGATIYQYAKEGKLNFEEMAEVVANANGQLEASYLATLDPADQAIVAMNNIKLIGSDLADSLQSTLAPIIAGVVGKLWEFADWFDALSPQIKDMIVKIGLIAGAIGPLLVVIGTLCSSVSKVIQLVSLVKTGMEVLNVVALGPTIATVAGVVAAIIALILVFQNWDEICEWFKIQWQNFTTFLSQKWADFKTWFMNIGRSITNFFQNLPNQLFNWGRSMIQRFANGIEQSLGLPKGAVTRLINSISGMFRNLLSGPFTWGYHLVQGFASGIRSAFSLVSNAVSSVTNFVRRHLHFTVPDEGPLADADQWGPDFMKLLANGIHSNKQKVFEEVNSVAQGLQMKASVNSQMTQTFANNQVVHVINRNVLELDGEQVFANMTERATQSARMANVFVGV